MRNGKRPTILSLTLRVALCGVIAILLAACSPGRFVSVVNPFDNSDKDTLAALYNATGGADWKNSSGWMSDRYVGTWHGVRYVRDERTTGTAIWRRIHPHRGSGSRAGVEQQRVEGRDPFRTGKA